MQVSQQIFTAFATRESTHVELFQALMNHIINIGLSMARDSQHMGVEPKIGGKPPKMDGENNGNPYFQMDDLGVTSPYFWVDTTHAELLRWEFSCLCNSLRALANGWKSKLIHAIGGVLS